MRVKQNRKRRDWNRPIRRVCAALIVIELAVAVFANPYLRVTEVKVYGAQTLTPQVIFEQAHVPARTNIFWMALREPFVHRLQANPVIAQAARTIRLPHTLVLTVRERQPYAALAQGRYYWLLDRQGVPYRIVSSPQPGLPVLKLSSSLLAARAIPLGVPLREEWLQNAFALLALLPDKKNWGDLKIEVDQNANICLNKRDNLQIRLGQPDLLPQKVALIQATMAANGGEIARQAAYIDVSCPDQPVWMPRFSGDEQENQSKKGQKQE